MHINDPDAVAEVEALYDYPNYWATHDETRIDKPDVPPRVNLSRSQVSVRCTP